MEEDVLEHGGNSFSSSYVSHYFSQSGMVGDAPMFFEPMGVSIVLPPMESMRHYCEISCPVADYFLQGTPLAKHLSFSKLTAS